MAVRLVHAEPGQVGAAVAARAACLTQTRSVLVIAARLPAQELRRQLEAAGADLSRVFLLDVATQLQPATRDPEHEAYVPGPAMLELIAKRAQQIVRSKAERPATVLVDDVATFAHYSPPEALAEILRQAMAMRAPQNHHEYVVSGVPPRLLDALRAMVTEEHDILPSGDLARRPPPGGGEGRLPSGPVDLAGRLQPRR